MSEILIFGVFLVDVLLVAAVAWLVLCAVGGATSGRLEPLLGWSLIVVAIVAGSGVVLGLANALSGSGLFAAHAALLILFYGWRRHYWRADFARARAWLAEQRLFLAAPVASARGAVALLLLTLILAILSSATVPLVDDALAYRLPRIGLWLREGRVFHFATADARLNYMPWVPDLITAWLLSATVEGWHLVGLVQTFGGGLLLASTFGLARQAGLSRFPALGAAALVLGLANVAVQFTTPQTDLFTAGVLTAAFCLWQAALSRGDGSVIGGLGFALALGSKGTVFYVAPGLFVIMVYLLIKHRLTWPEWRRTLSGATFGVVLFLLPPHAMNIATYGGVFGPAEAVRLHHGETGLGLGGRMEKLRLNLRSSAVQIFDPHAQPAGLRNAARTVGTALLQNLPESVEDPYAFAQFSRRYSLEGLMHYPAPDADWLSCGLLAVISFVAATGTLLCSQSERVKRPLVLAGAAAVVAYVLFQHAMLQWHTWTFRFMVLAAPWWAITVAAGLEASPRRLRVTGWLALLAASGSVFWHVTTSTPQAGWRALTRPEEAPSSFLYQAWRRWSQSLRPPEMSLLVALETNRPLAAFLRQRPARHTQLMWPTADPKLTAESIVAKSDGWLLTPLSQFIGREGRVRAQTWINPRTDGDRYSIAAYRRLAPGENPAPVLYRNQRTDSEHAVRRSLLVRVWDSEPVRLQFFNPRYEPCPWLVIAPTREYRGEVAAGGSAEVAISLPADSLAQLVVAFNCPPGGPAPAVAIIADTGSRE